MKALTPQTIIAPNLYVQRAADRQLKQILDDMGRPGYVLVARQMGKTNLLLNAKRASQCSDDLFAYVDVSNIFPDIRSFFRNIVDTLVDAASIDTSEIACSIAARRLERTLLPHKEHEFELRSLLRIIPGKIIVCLDEIDALTKTEYSDEVFSLIRSIYFSGRANFPEFYRLTYVLSGVAEPAEIIKNKEISPFNIGEKIYLEDFSISELDEFLDKASLCLSGNVKDRIFFWTGGNPRITWDLCSAVEALLVDGRDIDESDVDEIVEDLYLTSFDLPPVDHIRKLVEENGEIRDAVLAIHRGKAHAISDLVKSRLYLSGITSLNKSTRMPYIKNRILERALSVDWLGRIERERKSMYVLAGEEFGNRNFEEALKLCEEYIKIAPKDSSLSLVYNLMAGCEFELGRYDNAIELIEKYPLKRTTYPFQYFNGCLTLGWSKYRVGLYSDSVTAFRQLDSEEIKLDHAEIYFKGRQGLIRALLELGGDSLVEAQLLCEKSIAESDEMRVAFSREEGWQRALSASRLNLATLLRNENKFDDARRTLREGLSMPEYGRARVLFSIALAQLEDDGHRKIELLKSASMQILQDRLPIYPFHTDDALEVTYKSFVSLIKCLGDCGVHEEWSALLEYCLIDLRGRGDRVFDCAHSLVRTLFEESQFNAVKDFIQRLWVDDSISILEDDRRFLLSLAIIAASNMSDSSLDGRYSDVILGGKFPLRSFDFGAIFYISNIALEGGDRDVASRLAYACSQRGMKLSGEEVIPGEQYVTRYLDIAWKLADSNLSKVVRNEAVELVEDLNATPIIELPFFAMDTVGYLRKSLLDKLHATSQPVKAPLKREMPKIGRNTRVQVKLKDGTVQEGKFKNFEHLLLSGECELLLRDSGVFER